MLGIALPTLYSRISRERHRLPHIADFKDGTRGFLLSDVLEWLHADRTASTFDSETAPRGPGRPRKVVSGRV
jgi:hypothetical protein